ncbi:hypothetical protein BSY240_4618 (plasmid) [Agrobacterium sp. RAC06]|nr:hypothetical protein BSY240_4618 [Agrobacterium sp. RAC06]
MRWFSGVLRPYILQVLQPSTKSSGKHLVVHKDSRHCAPAGQQPSAEAMSL